MPTLTFPLSRIEGHAQVVISHTQGEVRGAHFQATELRGFEYFCQGAPAEQMPVIVPRICGVCSTAHHIAAVKALEDVCDITPSPIAVRIRELMMLGQLVQNQATSLFMFTLPDLGGGGGVPSLFHLGDAEADIPAKALAVRRLGTELITMAGGQFIHPVRAIVGGVSAGLPRGASEAMHSRVTQVLPVAIDLLERYWELFEQLRQRIGTLGDDQPAHGIGAIQQGHAFYGGPIVVLDAETQERISFEARDYEQFLEQVPVETSYSSATQFRGAPMHANSLARLNLVRRPGTPIADRYADRFWDTWSWPAYAILLYDIARGLELVYSLERAQSILEEDLSRDEVVAQGCDLPDGEGYGLVEAPRGPLIHHYRIEKGRVREARFVIPTQHNILAIERALEVAARRYIDKDRINTELEHAVGRVVRAFDPCIACATH